MTQSLTSPETELAALGILLKEPDKARHRLDLLDSECFSQLLYQEVFGAICLVAVADGGDPDPAAVLAQIQENHPNPKQWQQLAQIIGDAPDKGNPEFFETNVERLRDLADRRRMVEDGQKAISRAQNLSEPLSGEARAETEAARLQRLLSSRIFDANKHPPEVVPVFSIDGIPICTAGNLTAITAAIKTGKSAFIGAMIAATMKEDDSGDTFGITSRNPDGYALIHIDTEQSVEDHWLLVSRALKRAGCTPAPAWLRSYCLTGVEPLQIRRALKFLLRDSMKRFGGVRGVLIDGTADLVLDVNDPAECNAFVATLHGQAIEYRCPIINVIHFNPNSEKTRGHLGSQLERKAESNLVLSKEHEVTEVYSVKQRRAPILKGHGPRFRYSVSAGMHVRCAERGIDPAKLEILKTELAEVFNSRPSMRWTDLKTTVMTVTKKKDRMAERRIDDYHHAGLIEKSVANLWTRKTL